MVTPNPLLRVTLDRIGVYDIRTDKPPDGGIVVPGVVVVEPGLVQPLPGKLLRGGYRAGAGSAVRVVADGRHLVAAATGDDEGAGILS